MTDNVVKLKHKPNYSNVVDGIEDYLEHLRSMKEKPKNVFVLELYANDEGCWDSMIPYGKDINTLELLGLLSAVRSKIEKGYVL